MMQIQVRIFTREYGPETDAVKVELSSEENVFFHYTHIANQSTFRELQEVRWAR